MDKDLEKLLAKTEAMDDQDWAAGVDWFDESVIGETDEGSTQIGGAIPLGVEFQLGPGALLAELLFEIGTLDHSITGSSHTGGGTLNLGYRFML